MMSAMTVAKIGLLMKNRDMAAPYFVG
jgi:hypothetical protein